LLSDLTLSLKPVTQVAQMANEFTHVHLAKGVDYFIIIACFLWSCERPAQKKVNIPSFAYEEGSPDNPWARQEYESRQIADPKTGRIPVGILRKERAYLQKDQNSLSTYTKRTKNLEYRFIGPSNVGGRTRAFAIDITNEDVLVAGGVSGGMWRSNDAGQSWERTTHPASLFNASCLIQDTRPGKEHIWYHGTGELRGNSASNSGAPYRGDGIFKSSDGALTWELIPSTTLGSSNQFNSPFQYIWNIVVNTSRFDRDEVYAAAFGGILRSIDGGDTWKTVLGDDLIELTTDTTDFNESPYARYSDIAISEAGVFYGALGTHTGEGFIRSKGGIFRSTDGENWDEISPDGFPNEVRRIVFDLSPSDNGVMYFAMDAEPYRLFRYDENTSLEGIGVWTDLSENIPDFEGENGPYDSQNSYNMVIAVHPQSDNVVYLGGTNLYVSSDGFRSDNNTHWIGGYDPEGGNGLYPEHHPDQHVVTFIPSDPNQMYVANDGGIYFTENNLNTQPIWIDRNMGYISSQFYAIGIEKSPGNSVMGGLQDNGTYIGNSAGDTRWEDLQGGDGGYSYFTKNGIYRYFSIQNGRIFRLRYSGGTLVGVSRVDPLGGGQTPGREYLFVNPFVLDPHNNNVMYMAGGDAIWRNNNMSQMPDDDFKPKSIGWTRLSSTVPDESIITALEISTTPANRLYYGTLIGELYRVDNVNTAVEVSQISGPILPKNGYVVCIAIDPTDADHILVIYANYNIRSIFRSVDGGFSFEDISDNLEENPDGSGSGPSIRWAEIVPLNDGTYQYFVGTSSGLFASNSSATDMSPWVQQAPEIIGNAVVRMLDYRTDDGWLVAATHGNGVYETFVDDALFYQPEPPEPSENSLLAFPNPFSDQVIIRFDIARDGNGAVAILDSSGKLISIPLSGYLYEGENAASWDGTNDSGLPVADGMYYYQIRAGNQFLTGKLILDR